jgi:hypothetical protein
MSSGKRGQIRTNLGDSGIPVFIKVDYGFRFSKKVGMGFQSLSGTTNGLMS